MSRGDRSPVQHVLGLAGALGFMLSGCAGPDALEPDRLPFRVALLPIESPQVIEDGGAELDGETISATLAVDEQRLFRELQAKLARYCFWQVEVLAAPEPASTDLSPTPLQQAAGAHADLLVEFDLRYQPTIWRRTSNSFWLNFPLFLLAGPTMYFLEDNTYLADVELTTTIYDAPSLLARDSVLGDQESRYLSTQNHFTGTALSFPERLDSRTTYLYSIICPTGFLARDTRTVGERVEDAVIEDLARQVVASIQGRRRDLLAATHISPLILDPGEVRIERNGDGVAAVTGRVRVEPSRGTLNIVRLRCVDGVSMARIGVPHRLADGALEYTFSGHLPALAGWVGVEFEIGARDRLLRSFTFPVHNRSPME